MSFESLSAVVPLRAFPVDALKLALRPLSVVAADLFFYARKRTRIDFEATSSMRLILAVNAALAKTQNQTFCLVGATTEIGR